MAVAIAEEGEGARLAGIPAPGAWSREAALILTRRALHLRHHPDQWALPGGRVDAGESAEEAALRELAEEVGLDLDPAPSSAGSTTSSPAPASSSPRWSSGPGRRERSSPNPAEVASIHRIPVSEFMRDDAPMLDREDESEELVLRMPVGDTWIAAPTAAVLYQFRELCIAGRATRVAHFEQPLFARR